MFAMAAITVISLIADNVHHTFIPTPQGNHLLMLNGYTYKQNTKKWPLYYCSKRKFGCKASVKLDSCGKIIQVQENHKHDPPRYIVTPRGQYVKM